MESHFLIKVLAWASKRTEGFTSAELYNDFTFPNWQRTLLDKHFQHATENTSRRGMPSYPEISETIFYHIQGGIFVLSTEALFKYIDYKELELARKNATQARNYSLVAIGISVLAIMVSALVPIWIANKMTQTVEISDEQVSQYENQWKETQLDINLIRQELLPPKVEFQETSIKAEFNEVFTSSTSQKSYEAIVEDRQKKADEINNQLFYLHN